MCAAPIVIGPRPLHASAGFSLNELGPAAAGCRVWLIDLDRSPHARTLFLPASDRVRIRAIKDARERRRRQATYATLRHLLGAWIGPRAYTAPILRTRSGAPSLHGIPAAFSLSHSGRYGLVALAPRGRLGVDLEVARALSMPAARRTQLAAAATAVGPRALDPALDADVLQAWTRLEALAKATGEGIGRTLTALGVRARAASPAPAAPPSPYGHFVVTDLRLPAGMCGAVARDAHPCAHASPASRHR